MLCVKVFFFCLCVWDVCDVCDVCEIFFCVCLSFVCCFYVCVCLGRFGLEIFVGSRRRSRDDERALMLIEWFLLCCVVCEVMKMF